MSLFFKKFFKFMKKSHITFQNPKQNYKKESPSSDKACFNCEKNGHFIADFLKPKKYGYKKKEHKKNDRVSQGL